MKTMTKKEAIEFIRNLETKNGTLKSLETKIGKANVRTLELTGFIKRGQEKSSKEDSWASTSLINNGIATNMNNKSIMDKISDFINYTLMKKTTKPHLV